MFSYYNAIVFNILTDYYLSSSERYKYRLYKYRLYCSISTDFVAPKTFNCLAFQSFPCSVL